MSMNIPILKDNLTFHHKVSCKHACNRKSRAEHNYNPVYPNTYILNISYSCIIVHRTVFNTCTVCPRILYAQYAIKNESTDWSLKILKTRIIKKYVHNNVSGTYILYISHWRKVFFIKKNCITIEIWKLVEYKQVKYCLSK